MFLQLALVHALAAGRDDAVHFAIQHFRDFARTALDGLQQRLLNSGSGGLGVRAQV
jgi:hypothetical protein